MNRYFIPLCLLAIFAMPMSLLAQLPPPKFDMFGAFGYTTNVSFTSSNWGANYQYGQRTLVGTDASGNIYLSGNMRSSAANFDVAGGTSNVTPNGNPSFYLVKYNSGGTVDFGFSISASVDINVQVMEVDASGNIYIGGNARGTVDFDPSGTTANRTANTAPHMFLAKYNSSGGFEEAFILEGGTEGEVKGIAVDNSGNVYITGIYGGTVDFNPDAGTANLGAVGYDGYIAKYNSSLDYINAFRFAGNGADGVSAIAIDALDNIYITGFFFGNVDFDPGAGSALRSSTTGADFFLAKYNSSLSYQNVAVIAGASDQFGNDVEVDGSGNIYATGGANPNGLLVKYNSAFTVVYDKRLNGTNCAGKYLEVDANGNVYLTGTIRGTVDFDPGAGTANLTANTGFSTSFLADDVFLAKYDNSGDYVAAGIINGNKTDNVGGLAIDANGALLLSGMYQGTADFNMSTNTYNLTSSSSTGWDGFLALYSFNGPHEWTGNAGTSWNNSLNWIPNTVPTLSINVLIPAGLGSYPILDVQADITMMEVEAGATVTIPANQSLTLHDDLINDGTITVEEGGSLVQTTGSSLLGSGTFYVTRTTQAVSFISSPINNPSPNGFGISATGPDGSQIVPHPNCDPSAIDPTSPWGELLELREDAAALSNCAQSLWFVKSGGTLWGARGYSLSGGPSSLTFSGRVNNEIVIYSGLTRQAGTIGTQGGGTSTRGWHLVGNPYPSPIEISGSDLTAMGFDAQIQLYNDATGSWVSHNPLTTITIGVGQGFQIRKTNVGGTSNFSMDNSYRVVGNPTFYKQQSHADHYLNITLGNGTHTSETQVYFYNGATATFDPEYDANKLMGDYFKPMLYTVAADERLSYNALPLMQSGDIVTVPLGVHRGVEGSFTLTFNDLNTLDADVTLEDTKLGIFTAITEGYTYVFDSDAADANERFVLHFNKAETPTGIASPNSNIKLYPNPTQGLISLQLESGHGYTLAIVTDIAGKAITQTLLPIGNNLYTINTENLSPGIYFIEIKGQDRTVVKFIKQ